MDQRLSDAIDVFRDHLESWMTAPPERGAPLSQAEVEDALELLTAANYGGAVLLSRLAAAGVQLHREDRKTIDLWVVEQVRMGNFARAASETYRKNSTTDFQRSE
ncbi:MAG: hypothetical protein REJ23_03090 [Brevundimonas sp.]|nr:hypothetical protein [Brevundimonas sp.]